MELTGSYYRLLINDNIDDRELKRVKNEILNKLKDDSPKYYPHSARLLEISTSGRVVIGLCGTLIGTFVFYGPVDVNNPIPDFLKLKMDILDYEDEFTVQYLGRTKKCTVTSTGKRIITDAENVEIEGFPQFKLKAIA